MTAALDDTNEKFTGYSKKLFKLMMMTSPIFFLLMNVAGLCIYWVAALLIQGGDLPLGQLVAFMDYLFHAMFSIMLFCTVFMMYPRAEVSAKRIEAVFDTVRWCTMTENAWMEISRVRSASSM